MPPQRGYESLTPTADNLLVIENLQVAYGAVQVLWDVSFALEKGAVTCIVGSNGAGKTTTLNCLAGVLKAKAGRILLRGHDVTGLLAHQRVAAHISLVPEGRRLWPGMSVEENLLMGAFPPSVRPHARDNLARVYEMFPRLRQRRHQLAGTLSGGEQQMCAIGRGLMANPELLMLDEPSLGLAPKLVDEIFEFVARIAKTGVTVLLVGQNIQEVLQISQYGYVMETGRIRLKGTSEELRDNPMVREAYLG